LDNKLGLLAHVSAVNRENYRIGGGGDVPNSAGHDRDYLLKLSLLDLAGHSLRLGAARNRNAGLYLFSRVGSDNGYAPANAVPVEMFERIEVLRGPNVLLSGMPPLSSVARTVNMVTKRALAQPVADLTMTCWTGNSICTRTRTHWKT
ncbi:MAG: hypothetical protein RSF79_26065, partial [Janthinobacterium sp.]